MLRRLRTTTAAKLRRTGRRSQAPPIALLVTLGAAQVAYGLGPRPQPPRATRGILLLALATSAVEAARNRGRRGALVPAVAAGVGLVSELIGVAIDRPFGRYSYSDKLGPHVRGVPVLVPVAWAALARPAWTVAGHLSAAPRVRVPAAAAALTAWDVFLDPRMVEEGYWTWAAGGRYADVPASNFFGWFVTGLAIFSVVATFDGDAPDARDDLALGLYAWTWVGETFANAALWGRTLPAAAGTVAMGALTVPAIWRRLR